MNSGKPLLVVGHKNPDTDSVCSAIAYARYKTTLQKESAVACRAGNINAQTRHALEAFGVEPPEILPDVYPRIRDIMIPREQLFLVAPADAIAGARRIMLDNRFSFLPVTDERGRCVGRITALGLARLLDELDPASFAKDVRINLAAFCEMAGLVGFYPLVDPGAQQDGKQTPDPPDPPEWFEGTLVVDHLEGILAASPEDAALAVAAAVDDAGRTAERMSDWARERGTPLLAVGSSLPQTIASLRISRTVATCMEDIGPTFHGDDTLREILREVNRSNEGGFVVLDSDECIAGVVTRMNFMTDARFRVVLVDHNEFSQSVDGMEHANVVEIIDHHRIGGRSTSEPITFMNRAVGSTCTIIADLYHNSGTQPDRGTAGILLSGILSDTIILRSPTTTETDRSMARWLAPIAGVEIDSYGEEMFEAGSDIRELSARTILERDMKYYEEAGLQFSVSQVEMIGFKVFWDRADEIVAETRAHVSRAGLVFACLMVTDITSSTTLLVSAGENRVLSAVAYPQAAPGVFTMSGVLSRKKQVLPFLVDLVNDL